AMTRALDPVIAAVEARIPPRRRRAVIPQTIRCLWPATATRGSRPATAGAVREADSPLIGPHPHRVRRGARERPQGVKPEALQPRRNSLSHKGAAVHPDFGLSQEQIDAIAERRTPEFDDPDDGSSTNLPIAITRTTA